jgi:PAS domain S-box-containing protein
VTDITGEAILRSLTGRTDPFMPPAKAGFPGKSLTWVNAPRPGHAETSSMSGPLKIPERPAATAPVLPTFRLPLRTTDFDAGLAGLLHGALKGASRRESLAGLCAHLARVLRLRLATLARRTDAGTMALDAASAENDLWLELQRIPERWDSGLSSRGPAAEALRAAGPVRMRPADEGFALWRAAAESERVREILALPVEAPGGVRVLALYFENDIAPGASHGTLTIERLAQALETFLADLSTIEQRALVARALASAGNAAFITDLEGTIVWSNPAFSALSGYAAHEVVGRNPNLLRSGQQGTRYYRDLWGTIRAGKVWSAETVDRARDGTEYTILQTVSPVADGDRITHYVSIQQDVGAARRERERLELASRVSPETGLLTRAAFENAVTEALAAEPEQPAALAIVALRGLQHAAAAMGEDMTRLVAAALGRRVREAVDAPETCGSLGPFEYGLLLRGDVGEARVAGRLRALEEKLAEPLPYLGDVPALDIHCGVAFHPAEARAYHDLWLKADRQLANEPYRRAWRGPAH